MTTDYSSTAIDPAMATAMGGMMAAIYIVYFAFLIVCIVGMWKMFVKAGKPGWASIVPFYNTYCLFEMGFGNGLMFLLTFIPCAGTIFQIILCFKLATAFGRGVGTGFGLLFLSPIFYMILGFGDAEFIGPQ